MLKKLNTLKNRKELDTTTTLGQNSFANLFNVVNRGKLSYFNLCKNLSFDNVEFIDQSLYTTYMVQENDCWTNISYKTYGTIDLWWLIAKFNNVKNPFIGLTPGSYIKIPGDEIKETILDSIKVM